MATSALQAKRYAQAVFEIAKEKKEMDRWRADLQRTAALASLPELAEVMDNPRFSFEDKSRFISQQIQNINPLILNFLYLLISKGKFGLLPDIAAEYQRLLDRSQGIERAEITTAVAMSDAEMSTLAGHLSSLTGKKIKMTSNIDPEIIGGIVIRIEGKLIDGSTASRLAALKDELSGAVT